MWIITDGRLGHLNQLRGLIERLQAKAEIELHWLDLSAQPSAYSLIVLAMSIASLKPLRSEFDL